MGTFVTGELRRTGGALIMPNGSDGSSTYSHVAARQTVGENGEERSGNTHAAAQVALCQGSAFVHTLARRIALVRK